MERTFRGIVTIPSERSKYQPCDMQSRRPEVDGPRSLTCSRTRSYGSRAGAGSRRDRSTRRSRPKRSMPAQEVAWGSWIMMAPAQYIRLCGYLEASPPRTTTMTRSMLPKGRMPWGHLVAFGWLPSPLKVLVYRALGYRVGKRVHFGFGGVVVGRSVELGDDVEIGLFAVVQGRHIRIGRHSSV